MNKCAQFLLVAINLAAAVLLLQPAAAESTKVADLQAERSGLSLDLSDLVGNGRYYHIVFAAQESYLDDHNTARNLPEYYASWNDGHGRYSDKVFRTPDHVWAALRTLPKFYFQVHSASVQKGEWKDYESSEVYHFNVTRDEKPAMAALPSGLEEKARSGDKQAAYDLGRRYETGDGVLQDYVTAYAWYSVASTSGKAEYVAAMDALEKKISVPQKKAGQAQARELVGLGTPSRGAPVETTKPKNCSNQQVTEWVKKSHKDTFSGYSNPLSSRQAACEAAKAMAMQDLQAQDCNWKLDSELGDGTVRNLTQTPRLGACDCDDYAGRWECDVTAYLSCTYEQQRSVVKQVCQ